MSDAQYVPCCGAEQAPKDTVLSDPTIGRLDILLSFCAQENAGNACGLFVAANMFLIAGGVLVPFVNHDS